MQSRTLPTAQLGAGSAAALRSSARIAPCGVPPKRVAVHRRGAVFASATAAPSATAASPFASVDSEAKLFGILKAGASSGQIPSHLLGAVDELYTNYKAALLTSGVEGATEEFVAKVMASVCERVMIELNPKAAFTFPSQHHRLLEPYNYYNFGQRYIRGLVDFKTSMLGGRDTFKTIAAQLAAGENVVLLANHQTEADPAVFALLLETEFPGLATDVYYVAGDRVVTDALCKPFSMGRNLFCVHSKKHLDDDPSLKAEKQATNRRTLKAMQAALNEGGKLLWIAPSGGRDRNVDEASGETFPDAFDHTAVELMRALTTKAKPAGHIYPFAMYSYKIMPPPKVVEKNVGEKRLVFHAPVGIAVCPELDMEALSAGIEDKEERQKAVANFAYGQTVKEYRALVNAINNPDQAAATGFSQPWLEHEQMPLDAWV